MGDDIHIFIICDRDRSCISTNNKPNTWCISDNISYFFIHPTSYEYISRVEFCHFFDFFAMFDNDLFYLWHKRVYNIMFKSLFFDSFFEIFDDNKLLIGNNTETISSELIIMDLFFDVIDGLKC